MSGYIGTQPVPQATQNRSAFTATAGQTSFATVGYTPQFLDVYLNGVHLLDGTDFTATNGSDVVLTTGAAAGDVLEVVSYSTYEVNSQNFTGTTTVDVLSVTGAATGTDLTLSGGVYLGGTGADNKLDDYETGSFTPTFTSTGTNPSGITYDPTVGNEGHYTKIGKVVHIQINIRTDAISNKGSGNLQVSGLPFVSSDYDAQGGAAAFPCYGANFLNSNPSYALLVEAETKLSLVYRSTASGSVENVLTSALNTGANDNIVRITGTYMTEE